MASAALAYKCMEMAYLRVVYSSHTSAIRDRTELHSALQVASSGIFYAFCGESLGKNVVENYNMGVYFLCLHYQHMLAAHCKKICKLPISLHPLRAKPEIFNYVLYN